MTALLDANVLIAQLPVEEGSYAHEYDIVIGKLPPGQFTSLDRKSVV